MAGSFRSHPNWAGSVSFGLTLNLNGGGRARRPPQTCVLTAREVRRLALLLPEAEEHPHWGRPSFRVRGRIFATLHPERKRAVLKLSLDEQDVLGQAQPKIFKLTPWGHQGWTSVELQRVDPWLFEELLIGAWRRLAPKRVVARWEAHRRA